MNMAGRNLKGGKFLIMKSLEELESELKPSNA